MIFEKRAAEPKGIYKGEACSPDTVKFKMDYQGIPIHLDRPRGFVMVGIDDKGKSWRRQYLYNYGFIPKTIGGDNDGLDVFVGPNKKSTDSFWALQNKLDGTFDEYKVFLGFDNRDEAAAAYRAHIPKKLLGGMVTIKVDMMKAMLGIGADGYLSMNKVAAVVGFLDAIGRKKVA